MTQDFAKPSTTRKPGATKPKSTKPEGKAKRKPAKTAKKNTSSKTPQPSPPPRRSGFVVSLVILLGAFIYGLYFLQSIPATKSSIEPITANKTSKKATKKSEPQSAPEKRFNFYEILPESEVKPPKVDAYQFKEKTDNGDFYFMIQTGSFRSSEDAEKQKAMIAFQGLKANIKTVSNDSGSVWHRVSTGPFNNRSKMNSALDKLVSINIQPLVKKIKK